MRRLTITAFVLFTLGALAPIAYAAKTHRVDARGKITVDSSGARIELRGNPFKRCTGFLIPTGRKTGLMQATCTHGTVVVSTKETNANGSKGTWKVVSGTKRYRRAKGSGRYTGSYATLKIRFRGTARF
jgi:hypothetical protein